MEENRHYQISGKRDNGKKVVLSMNIPFGKDIFTKAKKELEKECEEKCEVESIVEIPECLGCQYDSCNQMDHMLHPTGCLHIPDFCGICD